MLFFPFVFSVTMVKRQCYDLRHHFFSSFTGFTAIFTGLPSIIMNSTASFRGREVELISAAQPGSVSVSRLTSVRGHKWLLQTSTTRRAHEHDGRLGANWACPICIGQPGWSCHDLSAACSSHILVELAAVASGNIRLLKWGKIKLQQQPKWNFNAWFNTLFLIELPRACIMGLGCCWGCCCFFSCPLHSPVEVLASAALGNFHLINNVTLNNVN